MEWGKAYDKLFENRQLADCVAFTTFNDHEAKAIDYATGFVAEMAKPLDTIPIMESDTSSSGPTDRKLERDVWRDL